MLPRDFILYEEASHLNFYENLGKYAPRFCMERLHREVDLLNLLSLPYVLIKK